ncbi:MAG: hypothetical protein ABSD58_10550 [Verrucomicrobiia bacterium]|jgi:hypothetical protein
MKKRVFILANSIKHSPMRCIAGREVIQNEKGETRCGGWIRPVTDHDEGALRLDECCYSNGSSPKPLDVADISLGIPENDRIQPENWFIQSNQRWIKASECDVSAAAPLAEQPGNVWLESGQKTDRVSPDFLSRMEPRQSLYLIRPDSLHLQIETKNWGGKFKKRVRGVFRFNGQTYDLGVTDPLIEQKYCPNYRNAPDGIIHLKQDDQNLVCVSLTPLFQGLHYKVIAAILELMP